MAVPSSKATLKTYCLRALGFGVIDINVSDDQIDDRVDEALQYFAQYHYDGVERMLLKYQVTAADIERSKTDTTTTATDSIDNSITASLQDQLGVFQDSTLTFHNHIGFRSGVCFDYQMYDVLNRRKLDLVQCPLIAMEASIFETKYMNMKPNKESLDLVLSYKETCMFYNGSFNLLWHNNRFIGHGYEDFYKKLLN